MGIDSLPVEHSDAGLLESVINDDKGKHTDFAIYNWEKVIPLRDDTVGKVGSLGVT